MIVPDESSEEYFSTIGTTGEDGTVTFEDLEYGYYKLTETKAPENYRITEKRIDPIQITKEDMEHLNVQITVRNDKQYTLPTTGGLGTNIIKGVEILVISIFGILLTNRKKIVPERRAKEENAEKPVRRTKKVKDTKPVRRNTGK